MSNFTLGNIRHAPFYDRVFPLDYPAGAGPFPSVYEFREWFTFLPRRLLPDPQSVPIEPFRYELPDDCSIKFSHVDLHRSNIMITPSKPRRVLALVDWEESGWLPEYWEARKAEYTVDREEWSRYLPVILDQYGSRVDAWEWYTSSLGC